MLKLESRVELGQVIVELVGHHGERLATRTLRVGPAPASITLRPPRNAKGQPLASEGIRLRVGDFIYTQGASAYRPLQSFSLPKEQSESDEP